MKLYLKRLAIYYKNHIDAFALIFAALALVVFTLAIYVYTPLDRALITPRWPWAQGENDPKAPLAMIQFFACLSSILGVVALLNYRSSKKVLMGVVFYILSAIQIINDIYYLSEILRHLKLGLVNNVYPIDAGIIYTIIHLVLVLLSVVILILSPFIQKYTSKIKVGEVSLQDKDINKNDVYFVEDNALKKNEYGYNLDELDNDFIDSILNKK